jgi:SAM-dependent methyltransferase
VGVRAFYEAFWADAPRDLEPWAFAERRALLLGEVQPGERVLDLGCGAGRFLAVLREAGAEPVGVEVAQAAAERARENVPGADVRLLEPDGSLPLGHGEIDLVWCSEVLEHIADVGHALLEVRRVLRRGGRLLLTVPFHGRLQAAAIALTRFDAHFDPLGQHVRFFTARSLARTLEAAGFAPAEAQIRARGGVPALRRMLVARAIRR